MARTATKTSTKTSPTKRKAKAKAAKPTPAPSPLVLVKPERERLTVTGLEDEVVKARRTAVKIDKLTSELKEFKSTAIEKCAKIRAKHPDELNTTCELASADDNPGLVIYQDKFSDIDVEHKAELKDVLDEHYSELVVETVKLKLKDHTTITKLKRALGPEAFEALAELVDVKPILKIGKGFQETRHSLRNELTDEHNRAVDAIVDQCQNDPQIKLK